MAASKAAPQQYSQPSRKGKKAWRKNVDVSDVQQGLERAREETNKGTLFTEKPSSELFITDTVGSEEIRKVVRKAHKPLKADKILAQRSAVPAVSTHKRASDRTTDGIIESRTKKRRSTYVSPAELERLRKRAYGGDSVPKDLGIDSAPTNDPWAAAPPSKPDPNTTFLDKAQPIRAPKTINHAPNSLLATAKAVPALSKPKPAHSYNPDFEEWDAALTAEGAKEVVAEEARQKAAAEEAAEQARIAAAQAEPEQDPLLDDASEWEGFESEFEEPDAEWLRKKRPGRKTTVQRNKIKRRKEDEQRKKHKAKMTEQGARKRGGPESAATATPAKDEDENADSTALVLASDAEQQDQEQAPDQSTINAPLRRRKYGRHPLPEPDLELVLPDELRDSLRALKPEGNLLRDRFRTLMVSGRIEARPRPVGQMKKPKRTTTEKWSYKDWTLAA